MNDFVVSFTTIPSRINSIPRIIDMITSQTLQPSKIFACIPYYSTRKKMKYDLPSDWKFPSNVEIVRCTDYGPATKLIGCISRVKNPDTMIITIDDDQSYNINTFNTLVEYGETHPESVICFRGLNKHLYQSLCFLREYIEYPDIYIIEGYGGVLYRRKFISEKMLHYFDNELLSDKDCFVSDDLTISKWMHMQQINIIRICNYRQPTIIKGTDKIDALRKDNRNSSYNNCQYNLTFLEHDENYYFPDIPIYVMNLPNRLERKEHMKKILRIVGAKKSNIIFNSDYSHVIPYITKADVHDRNKLIRSNQLTIEGSDKLNDSYVANALGHLDYINLIAKTNKMSIIMEDDIIPVVPYNKLGHLLEQAISELPEDADMLYLEMCGESCNKIKQVSKLLYKLYSPVCSAAILYTPKGAKKIIELCIPVFDGIDLMYPRLIQSGDIIAYGIGGMLFVQDEYFESDAGRKEKQKTRTHSFRLPLCHSGKMTKNQNILFPDHYPSLSILSIIFMVIVSLLIVICLYNLIKSNNK